MSSRVRKILVVPDVHVPFEHAGAWALMLAVGRKFKPTDVVLLGDFLDFYQFSRFDKNPDRLTRLEADIEIGRDRIDDLEELEASRYWYCLGNHEKRLEKYCITKAPALLHLADIRKLLMLDPELWRVADYKDGFQIADTYYTHDLDRHGIGAVRDARVRAEGKVVVGHLHRIEQQTLGTKKPDSPAWAVCPGWLGDPGFIDYKSRLRAHKEYHHGFATVLVKDGVSHIQLHTIENGAVRYNNSIITAA